MAQELLVTLNREKGSSLHVQIEQGLRDSIRSGRLPPGTPLPSSRALAQDLGISRGVVVEAYDQLLAEGYLIARRGSSTRVAKTGALSTTDLAPEPTVKPPRYDFRLGVPNLAAFPRQEWVASIRRVLGEAPNSALSNDEPQGTPELRAVLSSYLGRVRGVYASPSRIVICSGSSQGVRIVCQMLKQRGARRVVLEEPTHVHHHEVVVRAGLEPVCIPVDERGLRADLLAEVRADAAVVTPAHQYPTGAVLAPERRFELGAWAESQNALIVEDDYDAEYRYDREPIGALQGIAPDRVVYAGSASKTLAPCFRLGWLVLPPGLAASVTDAKFYDDRGSPAIEQLALADFISAGKFDRHLRRNRSIYRNRRDKLVTSLRTYIPEAQIQGVAAGLHLVANLPDGIDEERLIEAAAEISVRVEGIAKSRFSGRAGPPAILLGYGAISESAIEPGIKRLAKALTSIKHQ